MLWDDPGALINISLHFDHGGVKILRHCIRDPNETEAHRTTQEVRMELETAIERAAAERMERVQMNEARGRRQALRMVREFRRRQEREERRATREQERLQSLLDGQSEGDRAEIRVWDVAVLLIVGLLNATIATLRPMSENPQNQT